jgi:TonB family protein
MASIRACSALIAGAMLAACIPFHHGRVFVPRSDYPIAPNAKSYTKPGDCQGGSKLAAEHLEQPKYPAAAWRRGQQGWVVVRLDVDAKGKTHNVHIADAQPAGPFDLTAVGTVLSWQFQPPGGKGLKRCIVVLDYRLGVGHIGL